MAALKSVSSSVERSAASDIAFPACVSRSRSSRAPLMPISARALATWAIAASISASDPLRSCSATDCPPTSNIAARDGTAAKLLLSEKRIASGETVAKSGSPSIDRLADSASISSASAPISCAIIAWSAALADGLLAASASSLPRASRSETDPMTPSACSTNAAASVTLRDQLCALDCAVRMSEMRAAATGSSEGRCMRRPVEICTCVSASSDASRDWRWISRIILFPVALIMMAPIRRC